MSGGIFQHLLEHLEHVLPAQAPLRDFVHHNTLLRLDPHLLHSEDLLNFSPKRAAVDTYGAYGGLANTSIW